MKLKYSIYSVLGAMMMLFGISSCSPDEYDLGSKDVTTADLVEGKAFTIEHDSNNPNIVYLKSLMSSRYTVLWEHPQGRTQESEVTLKIPFGGTYTAKFGVETRGGVVYSEPVTFEVKDFCADFVTGEAWTLLAGGVGNSKTWIYDDGTYGFKAGELTYGDPDANPDLGLNNFNENWDPGRGHCGDDAMWASTMTFNLQGKAGYEFYNSTTGETQSGMFSINEDKMTLGLTDADLMHPSSWSARLDNWRTGLQIVELDENHLRVAYVRVPGDWGGKWIECFNYVSKEYADNYVPAPDTNPAPSLPETWKEDISALVKDFNTYRTIKWKIAETNDALAICNVYGEAEANGEQAASDAGADYALTMCFGDNTYTSTDADGDAIEGTFTIADNGFITFSEGLHKVVAGKDGAVLTTNNDKSLRVLSYKMDGDELTDLWLGYDINDVHGDRYKYQGIHFVPTIVGGSNVEEFKATLSYFNSGWTFFESKVVKVTGEGTYTFTIEGADPDPYGMFLDVKKILAKYPNMNMTITGMRVDGKAIDFDDSQIERCAGDDPAIARRYILNPWNNENYFMVHGFGVLAFTSTIEVDLKIEYNTGSPYIKPDEEKAKSLNAKKALKK